MRFGKVSESLPDGFVMPSKTSAIASPVALPKYHEWTIAATESTQGKVIEEPLIK